MTTGDEELMARYCEGDSTAFERLYSRYRGPVFRYIQRLCNPGLDAESLFQDVWMRVIRGRGQWSVDRPFRPWLFGIAHNRVVDVLRREGPAVREDAALLDSVADDGPGLDSITLLRDCVERLMALLAVLPEVQRSVFLLREEAGLSLVQIGQVTGVERETVKSRLRYALRRLRAGLEGCDGRA